MDPERVRWMEQWCRNWIKSNSILSNVIKIVAFWLFTCYIQKKMNLKQEGRTIKKINNKKIFIILFFSKLFYHCAYNLIIINDLWREEFNKCYFYSILHHCDCCSIWIRNQWPFNRYKYMMRCCMKVFLLLFIIDMLYLYCYNGVAWTNKKKFAFAKVDRVKILYLLIPPCSFVS